MIRYCLTHNEHIYDGETCCSQALTSSRPCDPRWFIPHTPTPPEPHRWPPAIRALAITGLSVICWYALVAMCFTTWQIVEGLT